MTISVRRIDLRALAWVILLTGVLVIQGVAVSQSLLWAGPLVCLMLVAVAIDLPIVPFLGFAMLIRVLTDHQSSAASRSGLGLNSLALIAVVLILVAVGLLVHRRKALAPIVMIGLGIMLWTGVAAASQGTSAEVLREGVRELSILAVATIAYNGGAALTMPVVTRIVQVAGIASAALAVFQFGTGGGMDIGGEIRANGTFGHPNAAAIYFALAALVSLWRYLDNGRSRFDLFFLLSFVGATIATFSLDGFGSLLVMMLAFGALRSGSRKVKVRVVGLVVLLIIAFLATPLGSERLETQTSAGLGAAETRSESSSSLEWRIYKWRTLIPEWEGSPFIGKGLGTTVTAEATATNSTAGNLPHNEYVRYLVETGAIGLAALLTGLYMLLRRFNRARKDSGPRAGIATLGMAALIGLMFNAFAANTLLYTPAAFAAALIVATALRCIETASAPARQAVCHQTGRLPVATGA